MNAKELVVLWYVALFISTIPLLQEYGRTLIVATTLLSAGCWLFLKTHPEPSKSRLLLIVIAPLVFGLIRMAAQDAYDSYQAYSHKADQLRPAITLSDDKGKRPATQATILGSSQTAEVHEPTTSHEI